MLVKTEGLHRPARKRLPGFRPVPVLCDEGLETSYKSMGVLFQAEFAVHHPP